MLSVSFLISRCSELFLVVVVVVVVLVVVVVVVVSMRRSKKEILSFLFGSWLKLRT